MPRYDYYCPSCNKKFEDVIWASWESRNKEVYCPNCDTDFPMTKLPSAPSFTIKGFNEKNGYGSR